MPPDERKPRPFIFADLTGGNKIINSYKGSKIFLHMKKIISLSAAVVALLGVIALAAVEMAKGGEMLLKVWGFISLVLVDIYIIIDILKDSPD